MRIPTNMTLTRRHVDGVYAPEVVVGLLSEHHNPVYSLTYLRVSQVGEGTSPHATLSTLLYIVLYARAHALARMIRSPVPSDAGLPLGFAQVLLDDYDADSDEPPLDAADADLRGAVLARALGLTLDMLAAVVADTPLPSLKQRGALQVDNYVHLMYVLDTAAALGPCPACRRPSTRGPSSKLSVRAGVFRDARIDN